MPFVVGKRLTIRGFIVYDPDMGPKYTEEHQKNMQKWIKDGEITVKMSVTEGIEHAAEGLVGMLKGENFGKAVLKVSDL
jgi:NADPH-dependent curcumin reductase CurA